jgi:chorismate lyase/3-hydroxybenzoate synthase
MTDRLTTLHLAHRLDPTQDLNLLGAIRYGIPSTLPDTRWHVPLTALPAGGIHDTAWYTPGPIAASQHEDIHYHYNAGLLCGYIRLSEQNFPDTTAGHPLQQIGERAYTQIFQLLHTSGFPHLVRCWNYLPQINHYDNDLERYRLFNIGRQNAFIAAAQSHEAGAPAASALGTPDGDVVIYFLAARIAPQAIENPRQISAYHYPAQYGPRSPTFSRGSLLRLARQDVLFISGTASIVGHDSVHIDDVSAQTQEIIHNIAAVIEQANAAIGTQVFHCNTLKLKIFVRHPDDLPHIAQVLTDALGDATEALYVQADICRADLLVEIEAFGVHERAHA